jgi:DNA-binding HxlR family transcriptional regulator
MTQQNVGHTPFEQAALKVLGGKWKLLILWNLKDETKRFSELKRLIPDITEKMLNQQLKELEKDEIVNRNVRSKVPLQVDYSFTEYGKTLIPSIESLCQWGKEHLRRTEDRLTCNRFYIGLADKSQNPATEVDQSYEKLLKFNEIG